MTNRFWLLGEWVRTITRGAGRRAWTKAPVLVLAALALFASAACGRLGSSGSGDGLLAGKHPHRVQGVTAVERINDGQVPRVGTDWNSNRTAVFGTNAYVEYDLGAPERIVAAALLADNNDTYEILGSLDGTSFQTLWTASGVSGAGMRWRTVPELDASARYVRLKPGRGGDSSLSVGELVLYSEPPESLPPSLREVSAVPSGLAYRSALLVFATALGACVAFMFRGAPLYWNGLFLVLVVAAGVPLVRAFQEAWPIEALEVSMTRGVVAAVAALVALRETFGPRRFAPLPAVTVGTLSVAALVAVAAFYNLGRPQFWDARENRPSVVHNYDMRVYYPVAKYFAELRYDGLYLASTATYAEETGGIDRPSMQRVELRDLRDHRMRRVPDVRNEILAIKDRFTPERWAELKEDMRYFWETMGPRAYLGSMVDHGGNATPFWLAITHLMFAKTTASNSVLLWAGALDPLMLVGLFIAIWRSFGVRTALVSMVIFGANDFYMFGSNWAGATLRHDWMVYLGLGACAFKTERYKLGGALLALSALIRAFPAITLIALVVPVAWYVFERTKKDGKLPGLSDVVSAHRWFVQAALGATIAVVSAVLFSSLVLGFDAWPLWVQKISSFTSDPHVNHVSLLTVTSGSEGNQVMVRNSRMPFHLGAIAVYLVLALWLARRAKPHQVALLGMMMMPVLMYPANYYIHFIFVLAMLVDERPRGSVPRLDQHAGKVWVILLGLCAAQYFTVKEKDMEVHFYNASVLLMAALLFVLVVLLKRSLEEHGGLSLLAADGVAFAPGALPDSEPAAPQAEAASEGESSNAATVPQRDDTEDAAEPGTERSIAESSEGANPAPVEQGEAADVEPKS